MCTGVEVALIVSAAASAGAAYESGQAQKEAADFQAQQYRENAKNAKLAADQQAVERQKEADRTRAMNLVYASSAGIDPSTSRSFETVQSTNDANAKQDIANIRLNGTLATSRFQMAATQAGIQGAAASRGGIFKAGTILASAGFKGADKYNWFSSDNGGLYSSPGDAPGTVQFNDYVTDSPVD